MMCDMSSKAGSVMASFAVMSHALGRTLTRASQAAW